MDLVLIIFSGCIIADPINSRFGRRGTIFFAALWCFASVIGSAFTHSWGALFAARICLGNIRFFPSFFLTRFSLLLKA
jgi:MFS family permease